MVQGGREVVQSVGTECTEHELELASVIASDRRLASLITATTGMDIWPPLITSHQLI